jgi:hypothetical protein
MRRALIAAVAALLIALGTLAVIFAASEFRTKSQRPLHEAFSDFVFVVDTGVRQVFGVPFPALTDATFGSAMGHARSGAHRYVDEAVGLRLTQWGEPVLPLLARELDRFEAAAAARDYSRIYVAIESTGEIGGPHAGEILVGWLSADGRLERIAHPRAGGGVLSHVVPALARVRDPRATELLIECYRRGYSQRAGGRVLDSIGRSQTPNATAFLLEAYAQARSDAEIDELVWPLAFTHDARAGAIVAQLRLHPSERVRHSAMSAASQERGPHLLEPYLALLERDAGDAIHAEALQVIAHRANRGDARALAAAAKRIGHPFLDRDARHALLVLLDEPSLPAYRETLAILEPRDMRAALRHLGAAALPLAQALLDSPAKSSQRAKVVKQIAIQKVLEGRGLLTRLVSDPDPEIREAARWSLARLDKMALLHDFLGHLPKQVASAAWREIQGGEDEGDLLADHSYGRGFDAVWRVFIAVHAAGTLFAAWLGLRLVLNAIRVFHAYRFNLFIQFLLAEGFLGDFFFMDFGPRPDLAYLAATMAHLLLAIGFLAKQRERLPGDARSRFERLGGASLWLLVPLLLYFGAPPLAQALRTAFSSFQGLAIFASLTCVLGLLVLEHAVLSVSLFVRSARAERVLSFLFSVAICGFVAGALLRSAELRAAAGESDARSFAYLLLAPLVWMLALHAGSLGLLARNKPARKLAAPATPRMRPIQDDDTVTVWFAPQPTATVRALALAAKWSFVLAVAGIGGYYAGRAAGLPAVIVGVIAALAGAVLAALMLQAVGARVLVQIRDGYARCADTTLGGVFGRAGWSRRILFPASVRRWLTRQRGAALEDGPLDPAELAWLEDVMAGGSGAVATRSAPARQIAIEAAATGLAASPTCGIPITIRLANRGAYPVSVASLERGKTGSRWQAWLDGHACDVFFDRAARERSIAPGASAELPARVFLPPLAARLREAVLRVACGPEQSNSLKVALDAQS